MIRRAKLWLFLGACLSCFYITALIKDYGASEVSCVKTIWYLNVLITTLQVLNLLNKVGAVIALGDHEIDVRTIFFWHKNKMLCMLYLLIQVVKTISSAILFYKLVSISNSCTYVIKSFAMFWCATELQVYLFMIVFSILAILFVIGSCFLIVLRVCGNFPEMFEIRDPEPVPINPGIEMSVDKKNTSHQKLDVKKTEVEGKACSICHENEKTNACIPCGHMCLCAICAEDLSKKGVKGQNIKRCPICCQEVENFSRIFQ
jgi:hypothetical protein